MRHLLWLLVVTGCGRLGFGWSGDDTQPSNGDASSDVSADSGVSPVGLVGSWKLDDASGQVASDSSGGGHDATLPDSLGWVAGHIGGGLNLDGTTRYGQVSTPALLGTGAATMAAWMMPRSVPGTTMIVYSDGYRGLYCGYDFASQLTCSNDGGVTNGMSGGLSTGAWHHFAAVRAADGTHTYYIDGVQSGLPGQAAGPVSSGTFNGGLGARYDGVGIFDGLLDDIRLYTRALTPAEIALLAQ